MPYDDEIRDQARPGRGPGPARGIRAGQGGRLVRAARRVAAVATGRSWARILTAAGAAVGVAAALAVSAPSASAQPPHGYGAAMAAIPGAGGNTVIALQTPRNAPLLYWDEYS